MGTRINETERGLLYFLGFFLLIFLLALLTGCAGTLDKAMATCFALEKNPAYTKSEGFERFECNSNGPVQTRASR